jgi:porin
VGYQQLRLEQLHAPEPVLVAGATDGVASFGRGKYFEAAEIGWSPELPGLERGTYRFMGWHTAATAQHREGSGVALSFDQEIGDGIVPFLRVGYCPDDVFQTSLEVSWGVAAVRPFDRATDLAGIGATWGKPVQASTRDQFAMDLFYRLQVVDGIQITSDVELVFDPALQPGRSFVAVFGLRSRIAL